MARSKRHFENPPSVSSDGDVEKVNDSDRNDAVEDDAMDEEPPVTGNTDGGAQYDSPARSVSDSGREGTPPSPTLSGFLIEPIRSAAVEESAVKPKKSSGKSGTKRAAPATAEVGRDGGEPKTRKKKKSSSSAVAEVAVADNAAAATVTPTPAAAGGDEEENKKSHGAVPRLWSAEDEIAILKGMYEYRAKTGSDPISDSGAFFGFIKDSFHVEVSKNQLMDKIRKLRRKFRVNIERSEKGEDLIFAKPHDSKAFELSEKIWGKREADEETLNGSNANGNKKRAKHSKSNKDTPDLVHEPGFERPLTFGLPKQDASLKKHRKKENAESRANRDEPAKGNLEQESKTNPDEPAKGSLERKQVVVESKSKSNPEAVDNRIEEIVEKGNDGKEEMDAVDSDEFWVRYPYLLDAVETMVSQRVLGDFPKGLLLEKVRASGGDEAKEWDHKWKALRFEEMQLHIKKLDIAAEISKAALDGLQR